MDLEEYANTFRIVGVARDAKYIEPEKPARPMFFVPLAQYVSYKHDMMQNVELNSHLMSGAMVVTPLDAGGLEPVLRKTFADVDPNLTIISVQPMQKLGCAARFRK